MFKRYIKVDISHHKANAPLSHIKIFAGLILNRKNQNNTPHTIAIITVVRNRLYTKVITPNTHKIIINRPPASPSSPSTILIALTIVMVNTNVIRGYIIPRSI